MTRANFTLTLLLMLAASPFGGGLLPCTGVAIAAPEDDVVGTWSGTFRARHAQKAPFTLNITVDQNKHARITNTSGITSCLARGDVDLHVIVNGTDVVFAGTDNNGNSITFHGTIDKTGKVLTFNYVTNGSASGKCESDDGTANLQKQ
jgi:hypothetical protein